MSCSSAHSESLMADGERCEVWGVGCEVWGVGCDVWGVRCEGRIRCTSRL
jgi:hypothetical protein